MAHGVAHSPVPVNTVSYKPGDRMCASTNCVSQQRTKRQVITKLRADHCQPLPVQSSSWISVQQFSNSPSPLSELLCSGYTFICLHKTSPTRRSGKAFRAKIVPSKETAIFARPIAPAPCGAAFSVYYSTRWTDRTI